jgi:hypothetical protein
MTPDRLDDGHRLFGLTLTDVFSDTPLLTSRVWTSSGI